MKLLEENENKYIMKGEERKIPMMEIADGDLTEILSEDGN